MKSKILFSILLFSSILFLKQSSAQEATVNTSRSNIKNNKAAEATVQNQCVISITPSGTGCNIVFNSDVKSPRDAASGMASGRRLHQPVVFNVSSNDNSVSEITSPRDISTGQSSGKVAGAPIKGISVKGGKNPGGNQFNNLSANNGQVVLPADLPDGDYDLVLSWSWGESNSGSSRSYCQGHFILNIVNGNYVAIKTKGTGASNK
jgi:hypothetical protein